MKSWLRVAVGKLRDDGLAILRTEPLQFKAAHASFWTKDDRRAAIQSIKKQVSKIDADFQVRKNQDSALLLCKSRYKKMRGNISSASETEMSEDWERMYRDQSDEEFDDKDRPAVYWVPHTRRVTETGVSSTRSTKNVLAETAPGGSGDRQDRSRSRRRRREKRARQCSLWSLPTR